MVLFKLCKGRCECINQFLNNGLWIDIDLLGSFLEKNPSLTYTISIQNLYNEENDVKENISIYLLTGEYMVYIKDTVTRSTTKESFHKYDILYFNDDHFIKIEPYCISCAIDYLDVLYYM